MYQKKYLKYKEKYLDLKKQLNGQFGGGKHLIKDEYLKRNNETDVKLYCRFYDATESFVWVPGSWTVKDFKENLLKEPEKILTVMMDTDKLEDDETMKDIEPLVGAMLRLVVTKSPTLSLSPEEAAKTAKKV